MAEPLSLFIPNLKQRWREWRIRRRQVRDGDWASEVADKVLRRKGLR